MSEENTGAVEQQTTPPVVEGNGQVEQGQISEPEKKVVPLEALEDERRKRQQLEREAEMYRRKAEILEQGQQAPSAPSYDPEDIPSYKDVSKMLDEREAGIRAETRQTQIALMVQEARRKYADYDSAYELAIKLSEENPTVAEVIMASKNPAEAIYHYGKTHPEYLTKIQQQTTKSVADQINQNLNAPKTLTSAGGGGTPSIQKDWKKASSAEINKRLEELRLQVR